MRVTHNGLTPDAKKYKEPNAANVTSLQTQNICKPFIQRRPNVFDVGPTLYKCYRNVLCQ